ncbi:MAG: FMN-binding protein [Ruminococcus callidus]
MKKWENPKKILPVLGFLPTAVLAVCMAGFAGGLYGTGAVAGRSRFGNRNTDRHSDNGKAKGTKNCCGNNKAPAPAVTPVSESGTYRDGTYTGTGIGFSGPITVQVVIEGGKIKDITVVSSTDDSPYLQNASALLKQIIALQSTNVDTVSGATYSSVGLISAVRDALQKAGGSSASDSALPVLAASESQNKTSENAPAVEAIAEPAAYRDGVYTGMGTGFGGQMTVQVTVSGGKITDIQVLSSKDDSPYLQNACALLQNIIASQSTNVDAVSGATYSSAGLIEAVRNALANAATGEMPAETTPVPTAKTEPPATTVPAVPQETGKFPYPDGVYTGSGEGYGGTTKIELTLKNGTIQKIHVVSNEDDEAFFKRAETLISLVIQRQSTDVDAVSGATFSSEGILEAIQEALEAAKQAAQPATTTTTAVTTAPPETTTTPVTGTTNTETTTEPVPAIYENGTYEGTADCYPDADEDFAEYVLSLKVQIENDQIVSISNVNGSGAEYDKLNDRYISRAADGTKKIAGTIAQILEKQQTDSIDAVSGATCSSDAIVRAVENALEQARKGA